MVFRCVSPLLAAILALAPAAWAQEVNIIPGVQQRAFVLHGQDIVIARGQDPDHRLTGEFTKTARPCPPFCITPHTIAPGVATIGELEVIEFLATRVADGTGLLVDTRLPEWHAKGTIPGAVNLPFSTLSPDNPFRDDILRALGGRLLGTVWDFGAAPDLALFCNGPWCDQTPRAVRDLLAVGFPADKMLYYRGGLQMWLTLGLTTHTPDPLRLTQGN